MRRVSSRQRLVSWDAFDATSNESSFVSFNHDFDEESYTSGYETAQSQSFHSSTALEGLSESYVEMHKNNELDGKGAKLWTRRRKRDQKSLRSHCTERISICKNVEHPKTSPTIPSTTVVVPTIVPSYSWEICKPKPSKTIHFNDLINDLHIDIFSFLDLSSLRSVMSTNRHYRNLMVSNDARSSLWMDHCERIWRIERKNREGPALKFVDDFHLPIAATTKGTTTFGSEVLRERTDTNLSLLLCLAPTNFPTSVDQDLLSPRTRLSRSIQQTIPADRIEEEDKLIHCYQDSLTGRYIVRYTGYVGQGDRCIRTNHPLPRPTRSTFKSTRYTHSTNTMPESGAALMGGNHGYRSHRPFLLNILGSSSKTIRDSSKFATSLSSFSASSDSEPSSELAPFVVPFVDQSINGSTSTVNVTPRFVSYFEVSILKLDDNNNSDDMISSDSMTPTQWGSPSHRTSYSDCVAVGVATNSFQFQSRMPGWDQQSYGYHGDDGGIFHSSGGMLKQFGPKYGPGDTVGCGIDYVSKGIFFTLNGEFLGYAWERISDEVLQKDLFPVVGIDTNSPIHMNFGSVDSGTFQFDLSNFIKKHGKLISSMYSLDGFHSSDSAKATSKTQSKQ